MDLQKIKFLKGAKDIQPFDEGFSGAQKFLFTKDDKKYFIKIGKFKIDNDLEQILTKAEIPHPKIVDLGAIDEHSNYLIEEYIEGENLKKKLDSYAPKFIYEFGFKLGEKFRNLRRIYPDQPVSKTCYNKFIREVETKLDKLKTALSNSKTALNKQQTKFTTYLTNYLTNNKDLFKNSTMVYSHNDIKPSNFMLSDGKIYAVDLEGISYKELSLSLLWSIARADFKDEKNHAFATGWLDGLFNFDVPQNILNCANYIYMFNMCHYAEEYIRKSEFDKLNKLIEYVNKNYLSRGKLHINKSLVKVAKISDFSRLKGSTFYIANGSYSPQNLTFKCTQNNNTYFLKIMQTSDAGFKKILASYNVLQTCGVPICKIYAHGKCKSTSNFWALFEYVDYPELSKSAKTFAQGEKFGKIVANQLKKLKNHQFLDIDTVNCQKLNSEFIKLVDRCFDSEQASKYLPCTKQQMLKFGSKYLKCFDDEPLEIIHDDVKFGNILYDGKNIVFVDNESVVNSYQILNFQHIICFAFFGGHHRAIQGFIKGYMQNISDHYNSSKTEGQIKFSIMLKYLREAKQFVDKAASDKNFKNHNKIFKKYIQNDEVITWLR